MKKMVIAALAIVLWAPLAQAAGEHEAPIRDLVQKQINSWTRDPAIIAAVKEQNIRYAGITQGKIDEMDKKWRAQATSGAAPMIDEVLSRRASQRLVEFKQDGAGLFTEIFVMDNKGLNVAQSDVTSDYWQGDEAKWKNTYLAGPHAMFIDEVEFDESTQTYQSQVSVSVADPDTGMAIGAITVGVNVELLMN